MRLRSVSNDVASIVHISVKQLHNYSNNGSIWQTLCNNIVLEYVQMKTNAAQTENKHEEKSHYEVVSLALCTENRERESEKKATRSTWPNEIAGFDVIYCWNKLRNNKITRLFTFCTKCYSVSLTFNSNFLSYFPFFLFLFVWFGLVWFSCLGYGKFRECNDSNVFLPLCYLLFCGRFLL